MNARRIVVAALFCSITGAALFAGKKVPEPQVDLSQLDFRTGDIVFQHLPSKLGSVICEVTKSPLSHCGMVVIRKGELHVIEAIGPVRYLPLKKWPKQGDMSRFVQMRLKQVSEEQIAEVVASAEAFLGRPYDIQYELDDSKIYCSELVYKAYLRGAEIEVGEKEELGQLDWQGQEAFIRAITGGDLPLERVMVTPASIARNAKLKLLYSTFPVRKEEPLHDRRVLAGSWTGDYTIKDLAPVTATVKFDRDGLFSSGAIRLTDGSEVAIREVQIEPFESQREFSGRLRDERGIDSQVRARILDEGRRIIGTWRDDQGHRGVFSFEKK